MKKYLVVLLFLALACKSGDKTTSKIGDLGKNVSNLTKSAKLSGASNSNLFKNAPQDIDGFLHINSNSTAHNKFLASKYYSTPTKEKLEQSKELISKILFGLNIDTIFESVGLDIENPKDMQKLFSQNLLFYKVTQAKKGPTDKSYPEMNFALLTESKEVSPKKFWNNIFTDLKTKQIQSEKISKEANSIPVYQISKELEVPTLDSAVSSAVGASGIPQAGTNALDQMKNLKLSKQAFVSWENQLSLITNSLNFKDTLSQEKTQSPHPILGSSELKQAIRGFGAEENRLSLGFFDLEILNDNQTAPDKLFPFSSAAFESSMEVGPSLNIRALYNQESALVKTLHKLSGKDFSSTLSMLEPEPMALLNLDTDLFELAKQGGSQQAPGASGMKNVNLQNLSYLSDNINSVSLMIGSKLAQNGIFQLPGISIILNNKGPKNAAVIESDLKNLAQGLMNSGGRGLPGAQSGMQGMPSANNVKWEEKKLENGSSYSVINSPLGISLSLAKKDNFLILSTSEENLTNTLNPKDGAAKTNFTTAASKEIQNFISNKPLALSVYFDNKKFAETLENLSGLLNMFAPQNKQAQELLKPENIARLKTLDKFVLSAENNSKDLFIQQKYLQ